MIVISMLIILLCCPMSVVSHLDLIAFFMWSINLSDVANSMRLSTQTVIIANLLPSHRIYVHGSETNLMYL
jgi:hypothetical protein